MAEVPSADGEAIHLAAAVADRLPLTLPAGHPAAHQQQESLTQVKVGVPDHCAAAIGEHMLCIFVGCSGAVS